MERLTEMELRIIQAMREANEEQLMLAMEFLRCCVEETDCHDPCGVSQ